jgi:sugar/nucleoside kinase (ribokinase family)
MIAAREHGVVVSYDLNYRPSLWKSTGGPARAREVNRELAPLVHVMINEEDFTAALGFDVEGVDEHLSVLVVDGFRHMMDRATQAFPNFRLIATTLRHARTANINDWSAVLYANGVSISLAIASRWRSWIASAGVIHLHPARFMGCSVAAIRSGRSSAAPLTGRWR